MRGYFQAPWLITVSLKINGTCEELTSFEVQSDTRDWRNSQKRTNELDQPSMRLVEGDKVMQIDRGKFPFVVEPCEDYCSLECCGSVPSAKRHSYKLVRSVVGRRGSLISIGFLFLDKSIATIRVKYWKYVFVSQGVYKRVRTYWPWICATRKRWLEVGPCSAIPYESYLEAQSP